MSHIQIQIFRPVNAQEINGWLRENPRILIKGFSVAAGADTPDERIPLSICAILYESSAPPAEVGRAALAEADHLIDQVSGEDAVRNTPPRSIAVPEPDARERLSHRQVTFEAPPSYRPHPLAHWIFDSGGATLARETCGARGQDR